jgi:hypothetical protein
LDFAPGGLTPGTQIGDMEANAGGNEPDNQVDLIQLAPSAGSMTWHETASTIGAQTCHLAVETIPETVTAITG